VNVEERINLKKVAARFEVLPRNSLEKGDKNKK
jgi:hypothetical protein